MCSVRANESVEAKRSLVCLFNVHRRMNEGCFTLCICFVTFKHWTRCMSTTWTWGIDRRLITEFLISMLVCAFASRPFQGMIVEICIEKVLCSGRNTVTHRVYLSKWQHFLSVIVWTPAPLVLWPVARVCCTYVTPKHDIRIQCDGGGRECLVNVAAQKKYWFKVVHIVEPSYNDVFCQTYSLR